MLEAAVSIFDPTQVTGIAACLKGSGTITFVNRTGGYYKARIANQIPFEKVLRGNPHGTFAVNFRCYPLFYADAVADITVTTSGTIITNPGSVYSEPILMVTGSGNITLMVGTTIVELENISGSIVIDSMLQEAYRGTTLMNNHMNGEFPVLKPGANAISWSGAVTRVVALHLLSLPEHMITCKRKVQPLYDQRKLRTVPCENMAFSMDMHTHLHLLFQ